MSFVKVFNDYIEIIKGDGSALPEKIHKNTIQGLQAYVTVNNVNGVFNSQYFITLYRNNVPLFRTPTSYSHDQIYNDLSAIWAFLNPNKTQYIYNQTPSGSQAYGPQNNYQAAINPQSFWAYTGPCSHASFAELARRNSFFTDLKHASDDDIEPFNFITLNDLQFREYRAFSFRNSYSPNHLVLSSDGVQYKVYKSELEKLMLDSDAPEYSGWCIFIKTHDGLKCFSAHVNTKTHVTLPSPCQGEPGYVAVHHPDRSLNINRIGQ